MAADTEPLVAKILIRLAVGYGAPIGSARIRQLSTKDFLSLLPRFSYALKHLTDKRRERRILRAPVVVHWGTAGLLSSIFRLLL